MAKTDNEATIVCNHASYNGDCDERLNLFGSDLMNVFPQVSLFKEYFQEVSPRLIDFIEIATFIYVADQCKVRCQGRVDPHGKMWHRKFNMIIAVQDFDFWNRLDVRKTLERLLRFISDDCFCFQFVQMTETHPEQQYFVFDNKMGATREPERVMLFSGGLDSLGGAIQSLLGDGKQTVLVRHKSATKHKDRYEHIESELKRRSGDRSVFFTFKAGKAGELSREYTQRTRSILYFAFAAVIADLLNINEVRFYENGPVSLNLPMSPQVIGGKATRTTHPQTLHFFQELFRKISDKPDFMVCNPFIDKTKSEIIKMIIEYQCGDLIKESMSCAHSWQQTKISKHCGVCSQCIDRRVAIIAADAERFDDEKDYSTDFFTESVDVHHKDYEDHFDAPNKNLLASFFLRGKQIQNMNYSQFEMEFPEISTALLYMGKDPLNAAQDIYRLYQRLAKDILSVIKYAQSSRFSDRLSDPDNPLPDDCLTYLLTRKNQSRVVEVKQVPVPLPDYVFRRRGDAWELRFNGGDDNILTHAEGCDAIRLLLSNPCKEFSIEDFIPKSAVDEVLMDADERANLFERQNDEEFEAISPEARDSVRAKLRELKADLEADDFFDEAEKEKAQEEYDKIVKYLSASLNKNGKPRKLNIMGKRKYDKVYRSVHNVIKKIRKFDEPMAEHLKKYISFGNAPVYRCPNQEIHWTVS